MIPFMVIPTTSLGRDTMTQMNGRVAQASYRQTFVSVRTYVF